VTLGWTLSAAVGLAIVYGLTPYVDPSKVPEISPLLKMTYGPLHRTAWAFVIAWVIFACSRGYGGSVLPIQFRLTPTFMSIFICA
jgi:hypothetical protein